MGEEYNHRSRDGCQAAPPARIGSAGVLRALPRLGGRPPPPAAEVLAGPIPALVTNVVDGDTLDVEARIWLGQPLTTRVRLADIDTPELRGACAAERALAEEARAAAAAAMGRAVELRRVEYDKYGGRVVAQVTLPDGSDLGGMLVAAGLARPYDGGTREPWCPVPEANR